MGTAKVSRKGWVVIPREIRERYDIKPGDQVQIVDYAGRIAIVPTLNNPVRQSRGLLKGLPKLTDALLEERRQDLEREEKKARRRPKRHRSS